MPANPTAHEYWKNERSRTCSTCGREKTTEIVNQWATLKYKGVAPTLKVCAECITDWVAEIDHYAGPLYAGGKIYIVRNCGASPEQRAWGWRLTYSSLDALATGNVNRASYTGELISGRHSDVMLCWSKVSQHIARGEPVQKSYEDRNGRNIGYIQREREVSDNSVSPKTGRMLRKKKKS